MAGLLQQILGLVLVLFGGDDVAVEVLGHVVAGGGHVVGGRGPDGHGLRLVIAVDDGPAAVGDEHRTGGVAGVHVVVVEIVDHRLGGHPGGDHAHHGERLAGNLHGAADGVLALKQALGRLGVDERHLPAVVKVRLDERTAVVDGVVRRRQIVTVDAVQVAAEGAVAHIHAVGPLALVVQGHIRHAAQLAHLVPHLGGNAGHALRQIHVAQLHLIAVLRQLHAHHVVARTDEVLLDLLVGALNGRHDGDDGGDTDDDAQHGQKRPQLMTPYALKGKIDIF